MIPDNITKGSILRAIEKINLEGVPKGRESTKYNIRYMGRLYPPKYTISLANLIENGMELKPEDFSGGKETNNYLIRLGFDIVNYGEANSSNEEQPQDKTELDDLVYIATVAIQSSKLKPASIKDRTKLLENIIRQAGKNADIMILPAGFYNSDIEAEYLYDEIECYIKEFLNEENLNTVICVGVDGRDGIDQIGVAINKQGIISAARKFYPTDGETGCIAKADDYLSTEKGYSKIIDVKGKKFYLAICYDGYGIRQQALTNPGVDGILNLVHRFYPKGYDASGEVYFAKYSFAGSSKQWNCPTFGTAIFYGRDIPEKWPTGVLWNQGKKNVQLWKYTDNAIHPIKQMEVSLKNEKAVIKIYVL